MEKREKYGELHKTDFYTAYWWLYDHPIYQYKYMEECSYTDSMFHRALDIQPVKVNPKNNTIEDDTTLNTKTRIWIESASDYDIENRCFTTHDGFLDCGGDTFEEAIIELAKLVYHYYGEGSELLIDPCVDDEDEIEENTEI